MLGNAAPTPFDLRFPLFGMPVRIHPFFWISALVGLWAPEMPHLMVIWTFSLFLSILIHEMGHALMAHAFGWPVLDVTLYAFGGYCQYDPWRGYTSPRAIQVALAGPAAGFALYGVIQLSLLIADQAGHPLELLPINVRIAILWLEQINLWWGLINLLPVLPLDGGQVARHLLLMYAPRRAEEWSLKLSIVVAGVAAFGFHQLGQRFPAILFVMLCIESVLALQNRRHY